MKTVILPTTFTLAIIFISAFARAADGPDTLDPAYRHASPEALERWRDLKYGLRICWGYYSLWNIEASWPVMKMSNEKRQEYFDLYKKFNPVDFDAEKWMDLLERGGLKFFTILTKHHDGFSMYDTKTRVKKRVNWTAPGGPAIEDCDLSYSIMEGPFKRDIVKELCDAAHKRNIAIDLYFSHIDWYDADFRFSPALWNPNYDKNYTRESDPEGYARAMRRHREQVREILTNYGKIDMVCFDIDLPPACWPELKETVLMARKLQPDALFRNRGIGAYGDYHTPENWIPESPVSPESKLPWMVIYNLAKLYSYDPDPANYKPGGEIISKLVDVVAKGGNFMVILGPDAKGNFHPEAVKRLEYVGDWLKVNGEAIYGTRPREGDLWKEGMYTRFTRTKDKKFVYAIARQWPGERFTLKTLRAKPGSTIRMLGVDEPLAWKNNAAGELEIEIPAKLQDPANRPCPQAWAFRIEPADPDR